MKKFAVLILATMLVVGCGGGGEPSSANILRVNLGTEVQDLDPHLVTGVPEHRACTAFFEGLTDLDPGTLKPIPAVAQSWTVSEDQRVYTFQLRTDARWTNGDPVTAQDFEYSWRRILSPGLAAEYAYMLYCIKNAKAFNEGAIADFAEVGVKATGPHELVVTLDSPTPYFLELHTHQAYLPVHQATVEAFGAMTDRGTPWTRAGNHVGNGAYSLVEWRPNEVIRAVPNEHYWNRTAIKLDGIEFYPIDNLQTEERSFRAGDLHVTEDIPLDKIPVYQKENPEVLRLDPYLGVYYYRVNLTHKPFDDVRVRRALSMALDRERLTQDVMKAGERPAYHYVPPGCGGYESPVPLRYDPEGAKALLAEAGYPNGEGIPPFELLYNTSENHKRIAETVQRMWKETLGVDVQLLNQDWKVYLASMDNLDYDLARSAWIGDYVDPLNFLECFLSYSGNNRTGYNSPAYDALVKAGYAETDETKRQEIMREAEERLLTDQPVIPVYFYTRKFLMATEVKGYKPNVLGYMRWEDFWLDLPEAAAK